MVCYKVSSTIHLVDPTTLKGYDIPSVEYFKKPLEPVCQRQHLTEYVVLDVTKIDAPPPAGTPARHNIGGRHKMALAEIEVARTCDLGQNDQRITVKSHLGNVLRPGDKVMGYDVPAVNVCSSYTDALDDMNQDVVLVRKVYKKSKREWALRRMQKDRDEGWNADEEKLDNDMEDFKDDLEQDPALRAGINVYHDPRKADGRSATSAAADGNDDEDDEDDADRPEVPLAELLEGLRLDEAV